MNDTNGRVIPYRVAVNESLRNEMRRDPDVILMGEDIAGGAGRQHLGIIDAWGGAFSKYKGLIQEFGPERIRDTPISEMGYIGAGVGAAATGLRPIVELMFVDFLGMCLDQLMNQAAFMRYMFGGKTRVPLTVITQVGGGISMAAQHSKMLSPFFTHIPGLKCIAPSSGYHAKGLYASAIRDDDPVVILDHKLLLRRDSSVPEEPYLLPIGRAEVPREGSDVSLVAYSYSTTVCLEAAELLERDGIDAEVVDLLSLSPLDEDSVLRSVKKTNRAVVVDEAFPRCNVATDIAALLADQAFDYLDAPIKRVGPPHSPVPFSPTLEKAYLPQAPDVAEAVRSLL
jgi:pyruvate dehydrogenase E1 component beta subunit